MDREMTMAELVEFMNGQTDDFAISVSLEGEVKDAKEECVQA